jgi:two-component system response regulator RegA
VSTAAPQAAQAILLVDDDEVLRERLARSLRSRGYVVVTAAGATEALEAARAQRFAYAVVDLRMPGPSGLDLTAALRQQTPDVRVVVLTGYGSIVTAVEAMRLGAHGYLSKPADADDVVAALTGDGAAVAAAREAPAPSLARAEWEHIQRILADTDGNISEAARRLGITRRTLQLKLKKYPPRS